MDCELGKHTAKSGCKEGDIQAGGPAGSQASKSGKEKQVSHQDSSSTTNYHQSHSTNTAARQ